MNIGLRLLMFNRLVADFDCSCGLHLTGWPVVSALCADLIGQSFSVGLLNQRFSDATGWL